MAADEASGRFDEPGEYRAPGDRLATHRILCSQCRDVSGDGKRVVAVGDPTAGASRVFRWSESGGFEDLGNYDSAGFVHVRSVSHDGEAFAGQLGSPMKEGEWVFPYRGYRWSSLTSFEPLLSMEGASDGSRLLGTAYETNALARARDGSR